MNALMKVLLWAFLAAFVTACAMFLVRAYILASAGVDLPSVPLARLAFEVMELHRFAAYGAGAGGLLGLASVVLARVRARGSRANPQPILTSEGPDPDERIRARRAERAKAYLERKTAAQRQSRN